MKLLQINAVYGIGSTGHIVRDISIKAEESGIDSFVAYSVAREKPEKGYLIGNTADKKVHALLSRVSGKQAFFSARATKRLVKYIDTIKPDIVHLHNLHSNYISLPVLLSELAERKIKVMLTQHDCWFFTGNCFHFSAIGCEKWEAGCRNCPGRNKIGTKSWISDCTYSVWQEKKRLFSMIDDLVVVSCSDWLTDITRRSFLGNRRLMTIHNGVNLEVFRPITSNGIRTRLQIDDKAFVVLGMANKWLLERNREVLSAVLSMTDIILVLLGCTKEQQIKVNGSNVKTVGFVGDKHELACYYSAADVFVNLSWEDTFPTVNLESLACGTPIIAHYCTGVPEMVDAKVGMVIQPGCAEKMIAAINEVKSVGKDYYSKHCRAKAEKEYDYKQCVAKYISLYQDMGLLEDNDD